MQRPASKGWYPPGSRPSCGRQGTHDETAASAAPRCQFARVVKGVDLRSTTGNSAWVRTPQLTPSDAPRCGCHTIWCGCHRVSSGGHFSAALRRAARAGIHQQVAPPADGKVRTRRLLSLHLVRMPQGQQRWSLECSLAPRSKGWCPPANRPLLRRARYARRDC